MTGILLRDGEPGDAADLSDIFRRASLSNDGDRAALEAHPDALEWRGPPAPPARCRVAVDGGGRGDRGGATVVGFATTVPNGADLELEDLFVDPAHVRRGVARALVADVVAFARSTGVVRVTVDANPHALAFYGAVGFVADGVTSTEFGPGMRMHRDT